MNLARSTYYHKPKNESGDDPQLIARIEAIIEEFSGYGFTEEYDMQRYYRNCRQLIFAPITNEMSKNFIGQVMLGLPKSY